jgi:hypothetical protein
MYVCMYVCMHVWLAGEHIIMAVLVLVLQGMMIKRMSAPVQRGGGVCSARIRQVANTALVVHTAHALPTGAVTTAPVRLDGVARIVRPPVF